MSMYKTLGGDRLGSGKKMKVELHGYERSTFDLSYTWRSSMSAGTLVPMLVEVGLPGDTFDINLFAESLTHPTVGPLFGSYKLQIDIFSCPVRLYQGLLHNNKLGIGLNMASVKLPLIKLWAPITAPNHPDLDNAQINPSCILSYLGIRGIGWNNTLAPVSRDFNAVPFLAYWDIYKNYYANKQEEIGAVIHTPKETLIQTVDQIEVNSGPLIPQFPTQSVIRLQDDYSIVIAYTGTAPKLNQILILTDQQSWIAAEHLAEDWILSAGQWSGTYNTARWGNMLAFAWSYTSEALTGVLPPTVTTFPLENLDKMREAILTNLNTSPYYSNDLNLPPYNYIAVNANDPVYNPLIQTQEGLAIKTYQSDLLNNWLSNDWISGVGGINEITAVSTVGDKFQLDTLYLANKVYQMLNRIAVSGGSYDDWLDAVYTHDRFTRLETPMYHGGMSKELIFQEVVSNSASGTEPLGTLAGKGTLTRDHKGGQVRIKIDEPSYLIGLVSLTPRIDYSQGNRWFVYSILTMDDWHKPALDQIGFEDNSAELMAWWTTHITSSSITRVAFGKQTGWINYQTNLPRTYGNFAIATNEMFMTLNRRYEADTVAQTMKDMTTYIDPAKYNNIFAQTSIDAQNFWMQIGVNMIARRKMSSKVMPNL